MNGGIQKQLNEIKNKSKEEILEEAYIFLEIDHPTKVEQKKKGLILPFNTHDKDNAQHEFGSVSKLKLKPLSEEEKKILKEKVQKIKKDRLIKKKHIMKEKDMKYTNMR